MKLPNKNEIRKPSKTLAGVTPIAVMLKPLPCKHGQCLYCPSLNVPQSYTPKSPAVLRAALLDYNPYQQVRARLKAFKLMNHPTDKIELIIMGGTFFDYTEQYQNYVIKSCYDALNNKTSKSLRQAKKLNETAKHRCVALCIETRPDKCGKKEISRMLKFGATRVELGVQIIDNKIYKKINRGHKVEDVIKATKLLKDSGFKVGYHIMPALPGSSPQKDLRLFKKLFSNENFKPDQLKIYPCQVIRGSKLVDLYLRGKYKPYTETQTQNLIIKMLKAVPEYCRVMRIMREIPPELLIAGTTRIDLRKKINEKLKKQKTKLKEIRFREIGFQLRDAKKQRIDKNLKLKITKYKASGGDEYFLQFVNKENILFGLLRLRISKNKAFIRELHIYGKQLSLGTKDKDAIQHKGLGKKLIKKAEELAKKEGIKKLAVISGVGVRQYYRKLGYRLENEYMVKKL